VQTIKVCQCVYLKLKKLSWYATYFGPPFFFYFFYIIVYNKNNRNCMKFKCGIIIQQLKIFQQKYLTANKWIEWYFVGAQDFLPDFDNAFHWKPFRPSYSYLGSAMRKVKDWLKSIKVCIENSRKSIGLSSGTLNHS